MVKRIAVIDAQLAGVAGDMLVAALLDAGADAGKVVAAMQGTQGCLPGCRSLKIEVREVARRGIHARKVDVLAEEDVAERSGAALLDAASRCTLALGLSEKARRFALGAVNTLVAAEAAVHGGRGETPEHVHLHEAGSVDTLADVIGSAVALEDLGLFDEATIYCTPVAVGGGLFKFSHGTVSSPAPATLEILRSRGAPLVGGPVEVELATPTGVSLLVNLVHEFVRFYPPMKPVAVGYGAGSKDFAQMPNVVRVTLGEPLAGAYIREDIFVIETNLDDATGEVVGYAMERLLQEGARDVSVLPVTAKKGRPGQIVKVIADRETAERLCAVLIEETGTLGVRMYACERRICRRESVPVTVSVGGISRVVNVKVARDLAGRLVQLKPEYDEVRALAQQSGRPLREVQALVQARAAQELAEGPGQMQ